MKKDFPDQRESNLTIESIVNKVIGSEEMFCVFCHMRVLVTHNGYTMNVDGVTHHDCKTRTGVKL